MRKRRGVNNYHYANAFAITKHVDVRREETLKTNVNNEIFKLMHTLFLQ